MPIANLRSIANPRVPLSELNLNMLLGSPVLALPMQEGAGGTVFDISGYGNNGTFGASWVQLLSELWALSFNGSTNYVNLRTKTSLNRSVRCTEMWLNPSGLGRNCFYAMCPIGGEPYRILGQYGAGQLELNWKDAGDNWRDWMTDDELLVVGTWCYVVFQQVGTGTPTMHFNAAPKAVSLISSRGNISAQATAITAIGRRGGFSSAYFPGLITLLRRGDRLLSDSEIQNHFNRTKHYFDVFDGNILARLLQQRQLAVVR